MRGSAATKARRATIHTRRVLGCRARFASLAATLAAPLLLGGCAGNPYAGIPLAPGAADPVLQDDVRRAMAGDKHAQLAPGIRYEEGDGVPTSYRKAKALYMLAAADSGGTLWVYSPPISKNDRGRVIPVNQGPRTAGLDAAKARLDEFSPVPSVPPIQAPPLYPTETTRTPTCETPCLEGINPALIHILPVNRALLRFLPDEYLWNPYETWVVVPCNRFERRRRGETSSAYLKRTMRASWMISYHCVFARVPLKEVRMLARYGSIDAQYLVIMTEPKAITDVCTSEARDGLRRLSANGSGVAAFSAGSIARYCNDLKEARQQYHVARDLGQRYVITFSQAILSPLEPKIFRDTTKRK
jgi:hypothetical protein